MSTRLYNRDVRVVAGPLTIEPRTATGENQPMLALTFSVAANRSREPNTGEIRIYNLRAENRAALQEAGLEVVLEAGYVGDLRTLFKGDTVTTTIERDAVNWATTVELTDGGKEMAKARVNVSSRGGQGVGGALREVANALGLDVGNLEDKLAGNRSVLKEFLSGFSFSGSAADAVDQLASSMGLGFSVQGKTMQFLGAKEALPGPAVVLSPSTGLLGSPSVGEKGVVTARSLLNGLLVPGRRVELSSAIVEGAYVCDSVKHDGDTWGDAWTSEVELGGIA